MNIRSYLIPIAVLGAGIAWLGTPSEAHYEAAVQRDACDDRGRSSRGSSLCEIREFTLESSGDLRVDAGPNGGIRVEGSDRKDILVTARVQVRGRNDESIRALASEIRIRAANGAISADGPRSSGRQSWSVSYEVLVPVRYDLTLQTTNGGISIDDVYGAIDFQATNGGVSLSDLRGDVHGRTVNGGLTVRLNGDAWVGEGGLDVATTNGSVSLEVPQGYNAQLEAGTVHGRVTTDVPLTVQGRLGKRIKVELGHGGAMVRVLTVNGAVRIKRW